MISTMRALLCSTEWRRWSIVTLLLGSISALSQPLMNRRNAIIAGGGLGSLAFDPSATAAVFDGSDGPVAVLGANGRTGSLCVTSCLERGIAVRALTRTGTWQAPTAGTTTTFTNSNPLLSVAPCDVKDPVALARSIEGCKAVIYAASASKQGGNAKAIDNDGVVAAGDACLRGGIPRYIVLSSTATTRPKSLGYIFTNVSVGGIMDEKRKGEQRLMSSYSGASSSTCSYTIIRPGGLEEPKQNKVLGPSALEVSQGDTLAGIISRADLAAFTVELAMSKADNVKNTALELYYTDSAQPCEGRFKAQMKEGVRIHGESYGDLFLNIQPGVDFFDV